MIISFGTTCKLSKEKSIPDPLIQGIKTMTRRNWKQSHIEKLILNIDNEHDAYNKATYAKGQKIGIIKLTEKPYLQRLGDMPKEDLYHEGNLWNSKEEFFKSLKCSPDSEVWVLKFEFRKHEQ